MILTYCPGRVKQKWSKQDLCSVMKVLAKLHKNTKGEKKKEDLKRTFRKNIRLFGDTHKEFSHLTKKVERLLGTVEFHESLVHDDLAANNIIFSDNDPVFIDWEWSHRSDPAKDLLRMFYPFHCPPWGVKLTKEREELVEKTYLTYNKDPDILVRAKQRILVAWYMDLLYFTWKINNWDKEHSSIPKKHYQKTINKLKKYFEEL